MIQKAYDIVIIGGGLQGLSLAYNLARKHCNRIAVFDKGYPGCGASGRNGEMIRSAFGSEEWIRFFDASLKLWEHISEELNYNVMFTHCGYFVLASTEKEMEGCRVNFTLQKRFGLNTTLLEKEDVEKLIPALNKDMVAGGILQTDGGFARHDAVVWAYLNAVRRLKVDLFYFTEVTSIGTSKGKICNVNTDKGIFPTKIVVNAAGGHSKRIAAMVGVSLHSQPYKLEILATEPLKPFLRQNLASLNTLSYMHQTTRGEFVGGTELAKMTPSTSIRSSLLMMEEMATKFVRLFPGLAKVKVMRQWAGLIDMAPDASPVVGPIPELEGFILDCGWSYGFVGAPASGRFLAEYIMTGEMPCELEPFTPERFKTGKMIIDHSLVVEQQDS